jgi:hypothetical protein
MKGEAPSGLGAWLPIRKHGRRRCVVLKKRDGEPDYDYRSLSVRRKPKSLPDYTFNDLLWVVAKVNVIPDQIGILAR